MNTINRVELAVRRTHLQIRDTDPKGERMLRLLADELRDLVHDKDDIERTLNAYRAARF